MGKCVWKVEPKDRLCEYCTLTTCSERQLGGKKWGSVTRSIRSLDVGERVVLDHRYYNASRTAVSRLSAEYSTRFIVRHGEEGCIVERIS